MTLHIDIETYSDTSLPDVGVYRYADDPSFEILLFAYAFDDEDVRVVDLAQGEKIPERVLNAILDPAVTKSAFNAQFERVCLSRHLGRQLDPEGWHCTMVHAWTLGLSGGLGDVCRAVGLPQDKQKLFTGKNLIRLFCVRRKPSETNGNQTRYYPHNMPLEWQRFKEYCAQDVTAEREVRKRLATHPMPDGEVRLYHIDQRINDYGVRLDAELARQAAAMDRAHAEELAAAYKALTGLDNPNSAAQLRDWLSSRLGREVASVDKRAVAELLDAAADHPEASEALKLRQQLSKTSVSKYTKMDGVICSDGRAHGLLQFYGARTGRWSGRLIQVQNLPRNSMNDLGLARDVARAGDLELLSMLYDDVPDVLSQLIRTAFIPSEGCRFIVSDFSAIEARVIAWLAGEEWVIDTFRGDGKIYEATAAQMFGVPVEKITRGEPEYAYRAKGKVATLACIAEGELVLTDQGLIPIEQVTTCHRVWDGVEFVCHDGVVFKGLEEVMTYDGLIATEDHLVWVEGEHWPIRFGYAAACGSHLIRSGAGGAPIRVGKNHQLGKAMGEELARHQGTARVYDILNAGPRHRFTVSGRLVHNCGYQGGVGALKAMGADSMGLSDEELQEIVARWRAANPRIVQFWSDVDNAAKTAIQDRTAIGLQKGLRFTYEPGALFIQLPSGRRLAYPNPRVEPHHKFAGATKITFDGQELGRLCRVDTYGGKCVENLVQGTARDCLADALMRLHDAGYKIAFHVHDEVVLDVPAGHSSVEEVNEIMGQDLPWAPGLPLKADGFECDYYMKD